MTLKLREANDHKWRPQGKWQLSRRRQSVPGSHTGVRQVAKWRASPSEAYAKDGSLWPFQRRAKHLFCLKSVLIGIIRVIRVPYPQSEFRLPQSISLLPAGVINNSLFTAHVSCALIFFENGSNFNHLYYFSSLKCYTAWIYEGILNWRKGGALCKSLYMCNMDNIIVGFKTQRRHEGTRKS